jgi:hypothetical protein
MSNNNLVAMDFDTIKADLQSYLQNQSQWSDYNFEGSGLTQIINILAYNQSNLAYLANASLNECFIDSSVKRGSAISRAKESNYCPQSATSAMAVVNIIIPAPLTTSGPLTLPQYTPFTTNLSTGNFTFYNRQAATAFPISGQYTFNNVQLFEGTIIQNSFTVGANNSVVDTTFTLQNSNIDTESIQVYVQQSISNSTITPWYPVSEYAMTSPTSNTYFVQANSDEQYQLQFGDGVLGALLQIGNIVVVTYQVCNTTQPNTVQSFPQTFNTQSIAGNTGLVINTVQNSIGGAEEETTQEIQLNAPLIMSANNRCVIEDDYTSIIKKYASVVQSINVYGGEKANPPVYGKVFITLEPITGYVVPDTVKSYITDTILASRSMMTIIPEYVDPDYTYLTFNSTVLYDDTLTTLTASDIASNVNTSILNYVANNLSDFNQNFYSSQLSTAIDNTNDSILGNTLVVNLQKRFTVNYGVPLYTTCNFNNPIAPNTIYTNCFTYYTGTNLQTAYIQDDSNGNLQILTFGTGLVIVPIIGTVNYSTGMVSLNGLNINSITGIQGVLKFNAAPLIEVSNLLVTTNKILKLDDSAMSVSDNVVAGITIQANAINQSTQ